MRLCFFVFTLVLGARETVGRLGFGDLNKVILQVRAVQHNPAFVVSVAC